MKYLTVYSLTCTLILAATATNWAQETERRPFQVPTRSDNQRQQIQQPVGNTSNNVSRIPQEPGVMGNVTESYVDIINCFAKLIEDVEVPAEETGKLVEINVKKGDAVTPGQIMARIDSQRTQRMLEEAELKFDHANRRATDVTEIDAATKKLQLETEEFRDIERLYQRGSKSKAEYKNSAFEMQIAELNLVAAKRDKTLALVDSQTQSVAVNAAKDSLARHLLRSGINGHVFELLKDPGEWVQAGEPVVRIARMDKLRIQGFVDTTLFNPHEIDGCRVTAFVPLARDKVVEFNGRVTHVSMENYSDRFGIDVEIENQKYPGTDQWILRVGSQLSMRIHFEKGSVASRIVPKR